jgi:multiple sugar transport system ATP-binding protein
VRHPRVFLFDEPLSNLDAKLRVQMRVEIKKLHNRLSTTAIYVTHDQVEAMTLGDRVVVMRDGVVQQVGEPLELYNSPANRFVAGFLGSPGMNFAAVRVSGEKDSLRAHKPGFGIDVPPELASRLARYIDKDVTIGVRPEDLRLANGSDAAGLCFEGMVEVVEKLGSEILLDLQVGDQTMVAAVEPNVRATRGDKLRFALRPDRLHFFDAASEVAI